MAAVKDTATGAKVKVYTVTGPASYATGGFVHDASADFSSVGFMLVTVTTRGVLPICDVEIDVNVDAAGAQALGKGVIKLVRHRYDRATLGAPTGNPAGTTVQAALTAVAADAHTHTFTHDHPSLTSAAATPSGAATLLDGAGPGLLNHTHTIDYPSVSPGTGSGAHQHNRAFEYDHSHTRTESSTTDVAAVEIAATTNLSGVTFTVVVFGFGKQ